MRWNWQRPEWPKFAWRPERLIAAEQAFIAGGGVFVGSVKHLGPEDRDELRVEAMSAEALTTSEIEGEILDRASVQSSIRRQLGLATDKRKARPSEQGVAEMMVDLHRGFDAPLSAEMLFGWHRMVTNGRRDLKDVGRYRRHEDPMQVVSGPIHAPVVHFEAPPSAAVSVEMARFVDWFNHTAPDGAEPLPALARAGSAHLYFECIHPFEDGNGRIGRALAEKALAQTLGRPTLIALATTILAKRKGYYEALERNNTEIEITDWLAWFAATALEAQRRTNALVDFLIDKSRLLGEVGAALNARQRKAILRVLAEGPGGFKGGLSAANYVAITGASAPTATRDLSGLIAMGAMLREGERRYARYRANLPLRAVPRVEIDEQGRLIERPDHGALR